MVGSATLFGSPFSGALFSGALLVVSLGATFSAADAAVAELSEVELQSLREEYSVFRRLEADRASILSRWLIARTICVSAATALFLLTFATDMEAPASVLLGVGLCVVVYGILAQMLISFARVRSSSVARFALVLLRPFEMIVTPLAAPIAFLGATVERSFLTYRKPSAEITDAELEHALSEGEKTGVLDKSPAEIIRNVLEFKDLTIREVTIPRRRVSAMDHSMTLEQALEFVIKDGHSRYPVYRDTIDNVVGLVYVKDLFAAVHAGRVRGRRLDDLTRKNILFVVETQSVQDVLKEMQIRRLHLAVVTDEFGGTRGIVTLEDILEQIVGEIHDEYDFGDSEIQEIEGRTLVDASVALSVVEARLGLDLRGEGGTDFDSLGGWFLHSVGRVPEVGTRLPIGQYELIVREADATRIIRVEILRKAQNSITNEA